MEQDTVETPDGIAWYTHRWTAINSPPRSSSSSQEHNQIVLIPSGEGDCHAFTTLGTLLGSAGFDVLTFDNPAFSRTTAPPEAYKRVTPQLMASQIITLLDTLSISRALFFGSSSGGGAALALAALYPNRVRCAIVHEVPFYCPPFLEDLKSKSDEAVSVACREFFANVFIEQDVNDGRAKWEALGDEYHARLAKNYVTWTRHVVNGYEADSREIATPENLKKRPVFWTVGALNEGADQGEGVWKPDFEVARAAGLEVNSRALNCIHFPYVTIPEQLRDWIVGCTRSLVD